MAYFQKGLYNSFTGIHMAWCGMCIISIVHMKSLPKLAFSKVVSLSAALAFPLYDLERSFNCLNFIDHHMSLEMNTLKLHP